MKNILCFLIAVMAGAATGNASYRNVALMKAAYHSSAYDYNLTAQLATDGIAEKSQPAYVAVATNSGPLGKADREKLLDYNFYTRIRIPGDSAFLQTDCENYSPGSDKMVVKGMVMIDPAAPKGYEATAYASADGKMWTEIDRRGSKDGYFGSEPDMPQWRRRPGKALRIIDYAIPLKESENYSHFRITIKMPAAEGWEFCSWGFEKGGEEQWIAPSSHFCSAWRSEGTGEEWICVDLGKPTNYDRIVARWLNRATAGEIQASDDAHNWRRIAYLSRDDTQLGKEERSRYVRLLLKNPQNGKPYELTELEIWGNDERQAAESEWRLQRAAQTTGEGSEIAAVGYDDSQWMAATVPGTVLTSYINNGSVPDPNFADNQKQISESYFLSDFWYRKEFEIGKLTPESFIEFDGINWKAEVYLNGQYVGKIEGAFTRAKFNVTGLLRLGRNALAVKIIKNNHPGVVKEHDAIIAGINGGALGYDNPTFHASVGWDWMPTIRGRNIGIWNDVRITQKGHVSIENPFFRSTLALPDTTSADLHFETTLKNHAPVAIKGLLKGRFGDIAFEQAVEMAANGQAEVALDPSQVAAFHVANPRLWWPKGYGRPELYDAHLEFVVNNEISDCKDFKTGIRQIDWDENDYEPKADAPRPKFGEPLTKRLSLYINGRRFIGFGGNWGFSESNLNYRGEDYDKAVAYHADMNFTMIRNWVGQTGDEEFYEACDRHGIMIWQDFWLANPSDGPNPLYEKMFEDNAKDYVRRIRNHPSIAIYVGRNEGNPPESLDDYLRELVATEHPGIHYISHSAAGVVSGGGPYNALSPKEYFHLHGHDKFHSERGMPNVMNYEHLVKTLGKENAEKLNWGDTPSDTYGMHDYSMKSAQSCSTFNELINKAFGKPKDAKEFSEWAQWINYNGYRAIFESRSENRRGMLLWMSHPAWPSLVWQTYDYYLEPTAAYFGCKKACEPLHIQWNSYREQIEVVNYHAGSRKNLVAKAEVIDQQGKVKWQKETTLDIGEDQTAVCFPVEYPEKISPTHFIKLTLTEGGKTVSDNFYWRGTEDGNYKSLLEVPAGRVESQWAMAREGNKWSIKGTIKNPTAVPAMMIRLKAVDESGEMILPVIYSDNYFFLMPGESREIGISLTSANRPSIAISGMNL